MEFGFDFNTELGTPKGLPMELPVLWATFPILCGAQGTSARGLG